MTGTTPELWWCEEHDSRANQVLQPPPFGLWAGCEWSLWTFAAGQGVDHHGDPTIGRCRLVLRALVPVESVHPPEDDDERIEGTWF